MRATRQQFRRELAAIVGEGSVSDDDASLWPYGNDNSRHHHPPDWLVFVEQQDQVAELVRCCRRAGVPLVARGRGTATTGATVPLEGGVVLALERLDRLIEIDPANRRMVVEPGMTNRAVQLTAAEHGFFWPPDPTSSAVCSVGGNLAINSAGPRAVKYGAVWENTLGLRAVSGRGELLRCGVATTKGVVGYDLTRLLIGSEGTLAVITEATLKLTPLPEARRTLQAVYRDIVSAAAAVSRIMAQPVTPCALEFMDHNAIEMVRDFSNANLPQGAGALLMIEVDGANACIDRSVDAVQRAAAAGEGLLSFDAASSKEEIEALWATRRALSPALRKIAPKKINEDVVVPVSRIPELIGGLDRLSRQHEILIVNFGHAGNGNIHVNLLLDPDQPGALERAWRCLDEVFSLVLGLGGTLSGEHGVGLDKARFVDREIEPSTLAMMRSIKQCFDPDAILNPGKLFPVENHPGANRT